MVYDGRKEVLKIRASHGLPESVVEKTRLRRGEGIVGLAASQKSILLVDQDAKDPGLRNRMARPELVSSLVAPLSQDSVPDPMGVLSLRTTDPAKRFTQEHVELLRKLMDLASIALGNIRSA
jgi:GAF domain-containing protein